MEMGAQSQEKLPETKRKQHIGKTRQTEIFNKERSGRFHKNTAYARSGVLAFGVSKVFRVFKVNDILKGQKSDQGGPQNGQNFGWGKFSTFWASSSAKKVLLTAEKVGQN